MTWVVWAGNTCRPASDRPARLMTKYMENDNSVPGHQTCDGTSIENRKSPQLEAESENDKWKSVRSWWRPIACESGHKFLQPWHVRTQLSKWAGDGAGLEAGGLDKAAIATSMTLSAISANWSNVGIKARTVSQKLLHLPQQLRGLAISKLLTSKKLLKLPLFREDGTFCELCLQHWV